jgi:Zn-dependent peptidase ImmA (M78 family)
MKASYRPDVEALANEVRRRAGVGPHAFALVTTIAKRLLGADNVIVHETMAGQAYYIGATKQIWLNRRCRDVRFAIGHELGHWADDVITGLLYARDDVEWNVEAERRANYFAAAILMPEVSVRRMFAKWGRRVRKLANHYGVKTTTMTRRLAELGLR